VRKRVKKVRTAPLTIAERRRIDDAYNDPPPPQLQEADIDTINLQHALAHLDDTPEREEIIYAPPDTLSNLPDILVSAPDPLGQLSDFPTGIHNRSPLDTYNSAHKLWFVRLIFLLVAVLHTRHHVTFRACALILFVLSVVFAHLSLTSTHDTIPYTLDTVLTRLDLEDRFTISPACEVCQRNFSPSTSQGSRCPECNKALFIKSAPTLFQRLTGRSPPPPPPRLSVPVRTLSALLTEAFAHGPLEDQVQEWISHSPQAGQYNSFMDGRVAQELKDSTGNLFFDSNSLAANEIRLGVTWSIDWCVSILLAHLQMNDILLGSVQMQDLTVQLTQLASCPFV
jgi:DNA-directed RNA polymerase subunit RPC12/RpoP